MPSLFTPKLDAPVHEVKQWIKSIDTNGDGKISQQELAAALRHLNLWFTNLRGWRALKKTDLNKNGSIDTPDEFEELESYVKKHWGHSITPAA